MKFQGLIRNYLFLCLFRNLRCLVLFLYLFGLREFFTPLEVCLYIAKVVNFRQLHYDVEIPRLSNAEKF